MESRMVRKTGEWKESKKERGMKMENGTESM